MFKNVHAPFMKRSVIWHICGFLFSF